MIRNANWIIHPQNKLYEPVHFNKTIKVEGPLRRAVLNITSLGCYYAEINGVRVGDFILAPGFTSRRRVQYQSYDITAMLGEENSLDVLVGDGWYKGKINFAVDQGKEELKKALIAEVVLTYKDGSVERIVTDENWLAKKDKLRMAELYDGEIYDSLFEDGYVSAQIIDYDKKKIQKQEGVFVKEQEKLDPVSIFKAPNGDTLVDFGQNMTGYFEISVNAKKGERVELTVCEELDKNGNFYNENYRGAKARFEYVCHEGENYYKPKLAFWGFRYMRIDAFPGEIKRENIRAIVLHSDIERTGYLESSNADLNQLFSNIIWGQKGNFLDVPTDCPQRDERQGWTGDATVFSKTACYNYDVNRFFEKWLHDMRLDQGKTGYIPNIIPQTVCWDWSTAESSGAVWGDSATIIPYQLYLTYGNREILKKHFGCMERYVKYIGSVTKEKYLWAGCGQFGDWLGLDAPEGSYRGSSNEDFIASVFYRHSVGILCEAGKIIGKNVEKYERLHVKITEAIKKTFKEYKTQTECVLALHFGVAENREAVAKQLNDMIKENGTRLKTGFVGTPYLLHALARNGYDDTAYGLLLQDKFPSWLYSVKQGATTIWEHWDGKNEKGEFWSKDMNSFNHYAYGSVADWVYEYALGIKPSAEKPGFEKIVVEPHPSDRLEWLSGTLCTKYGKIVSKWYHENGKIHYEITVPKSAEIIINGVAHKVKKGTHCF